MAERQSPAKTRDALRAAQRAAAVASWEESARHAAQALERFRLPQSRAAALATTPPPAWVLIDVPMSPVSSAAIRAARRASAPRHSPAGGASLPSAPPV